MAKRISSARGAILREEPVCSFCGATATEQEIDQWERDDYYDQLCEKWEKRNDPNELHPGLPLTREDRVHHTIMFYEMHSKDQEPALALIRAMEETGVDFERVKKAVKYRYGNKS